MSLGFVAVVTAIGLFVLAPLVLAWVSTIPRRWRRVERVLGRELPEGVLSPRWPVGLWVGGGAAYLSNGIFNYVVYRRRRKAEESVGPQVEDRAEPGGPAAGG